MDTPDTLDSHDSHDTRDSHDSIDMSGESWLTVMDAAQQLGVSERQVRRYIKNRQLPVDRMRGHHGPQIRIRQHDVDLLRGQREAVDQDAADTTPVQGVTAPLPATGPAVLDTVLARLDALYREQIAAKDAEISARQALVEELRRRAQKAENERDALQRVRALEATTAALEPPNGPKLHESLSGTAGQGSDAGDLWATIAAKAAAVPDAVTQAFEVLEAAQPEDPPRRGLLARLFRRHSP